MVSWVIVVFHPQLPSITASLFFVALRRRSRPIALAVAVGNDLDPRAAGLGRARCH